MVLVNNLNRGNGLTFIKSFKSVWALSINFTSIKYNSEKHAIDART